MRRTNSTNVFDRLARALHRGRRWLKFIAEAARVTRIGSVSYDADVTVGRGRGVDEDLPELSTTPPRRGGSLPVRKGVRPRRRSGLPTGTTGYRLRNGSLAIIDARVIIRHGLRAARAPLAPGDKLGIMRLRERCVAPPDVAFTHKPRSSIRSRPTRSGDSGPELCSWARSM